MSGSEDLFNKASAFFGLVLAVLKDDPRAPEVLEPFMTACRQVIGISREPSTVLKVLRENGIVKEDDPPKAEVSRALSMWIAHLMQSVRVIESTLASKSLMDKNIKKSMEDLMSVLKTDLLKDWHPEQEVDFSDEATMDSMSASSEDVRNEALDAYSRGEISREQLRARLTEASGSWWQRAAASGGNIELTRQCCVCQKVQGKDGAWSPPPPGLDQHYVTHGLCPRCMDDMIAKDDGSFATP